MSKRPQKLSQASAYYRLAAKADRAGQSTQAAHYRRIADRFVVEHQRQKAYLDSRKSKP